MMAGNSKEEARTKKNTENFIYKYKYKSNVGRRQRRFLSAYKIR